MPPGLFRENLKRVFNIIASPKEMGYLMDLYDKNVSYSSFIQHSISTNATIPNKLSENRASG